MKCIQRFKIDYTTVLQQKICGSLYSEAVSGNSASKSQNLQLTTEAANRFFELESLHQQTNSFTAAISVKNRMDDTIFDSDAALANAD